MTKLLSLSAAALLATALTLAAGAQAQTVSGLVLAFPQPSADELSPGLAVEYIRDKFDHIDELERAGKGRPGEPLGKLDWNTGDGEVLTSGDRQLVGARITGYIRFPAAGGYIMTVQSNDGVRLHIGGQLIIDDPDVHSDRYSEYVTVEVPEPGWYLFNMLYFQKRGTATLELYWQPPGSSDFEFVPEEAFAHAKS